MLQGSKPQNYLCNDINLHCVDTGPQESKSNKMQMCLLISTKREREHKVCLLSYCILHSFYMDMYSFMQVNFNMNK